MCNISGHTILHSVCPIPELSEHVECNEGIEIVQKPQVTELKAAGEQWKAINLKIVMAKIYLKQEVKRAHPVNIKII